MLGAGLGRSLKIKVSRTKEPSPRNNSKNTRANITSYILKKANLAKLNP